MAIVASALAAGGIEDRITLPIARVIEQGPGPLQGGGAQEIRRCVHRIAGSIANSAIDTFNAGIGLCTGGAFGIHAGNIIVPAARWVMHGLGINPAVKERIHIHGQIFDDRQIAQGPDMDFAACCDL